MTLSLQSLTGFEHSNSNLEELVCCWAGELISFSTITDSLYSLILESSTLRKLELADFEEDIEAFMEAMTSPTRKSKIHTLSIKDCEWYCFETTQLFERMITTI
jgi:hypothetical protein